MKELSISERYMTARTASTLKVDADTTMSPADVLTAAGMAGQRHSVPLRLWVFMHSPSRHQLYALADSLTQRLDDYMNIKKLKGKPWRIAKQTLAWSINNTCRPCGGHGMERIAGTPHLSDVQCPACRGTGKTELHTENNQAAQWLLSEINAMTVAAESAINNKLKKGKKNLA